MGTEGHGSMVDKRYYEKLGGFSYLLGELRKRLGEERTDALASAMKPRPATMPSV